MDEDREAIRKQCEYRPDLEAYPSKTKQAFVKECDVNNILKQYEKTGVLQHISRYAPFFADVSAMPMDFHEAMNLVTSAQQMFEGLPAELRRRFLNSPGELLDFVQNPENEDEARKLGLLPPKRPDAVEATPKAEPAEPAKAEAEAKASAPASGEAG